MALRCGLNVQSLSIFPSFLFIKLKCNKSHTPTHPQRTEEKNISELISETTEQPSKGEASKSKINKKINKQQADAGTHHTDELGSDSRYLWTKERNETWQSAYKVSSFAPQKKNLIFHVHFFLFFFVDISRLSIEHLSLNFASLLSWFPWFFYHCPFLFLPFVVVFFSLGIETSVPVLGFFFLFTVYLFAYSLHVHMSSTFSLFLSLISTQPD